MKLNLGWDKKVVNALVDTRASFNVINKSFCKKYGMVVNLFNMN